MWKPRTDTPALLQRLREARAFEHHLLKRREEALAENTPEATEAWVTWGEPDLLSIQEAINRLKEVLATREHLPNKQERKKIRQARAKEAGRERRRR